MYFFQVAADVFDIRKAFVACERLHAREEVTIDIDGEHRPPVAHHARRFPRKEAGTHTEVGNFHAVVYFRGAHCLRRIKEPRGFHPSILTQEQKRFFFLLTS